ncbi:MAG: hypothetical protein KUL77_09940 [Thermomonas sp.]|jgi:hypothetical protein|uniref:hypothetical protein n=1 Tax=Thermomonas sp. TaxID=1971895 RepID=UPI001EB4D6C4|nr:hypothetical protein [Thermomonas sp.]MBV2209870.1 hypothetical protein [Thermomonas sp.]
MTTQQPRSDWGAQLLTLVILAGAGYLAYRLVIWLFPAQLHAVWQWIIAKF